MAQSVFTGPLISLGGLAGAPGGGPPPEYSDEIGPSLFFQGTGMPVPGSGRGSKDQKGAGAFPALFFSSSIIAVNQVLATGGAALTVAANAVSGTPLTLNPTYAAGVGVGTALADGSIGIALDPGYAVATGTNGSASVTIAAADRWRFQPNQFVSIAGGGPSGTMQFNQILTVGPTTLTMAKPLQNGASTLQIGPVAGNPGKYGWTNSAYSAHMSGGAGRFLLPDCGAARGVGILGVAGSVGGAFLVSGLDAFMRAQSEIITAGAGAVTTYGKKTYKVFKSAVPQFSDANNYTVVTSDLIGMPVSLVQNEPSPVITAAGAAYTGSVFQYADLTSPATTATGDPRGAVQLSTKGPVAGATGAGTDGTSRFTIVQMLSPAQVLASSVFNPGPLFGVPPV